MAALKPIKPRKLKKNVRIKTSSSPHFPIDFFENCQVLNDVEFGGKDILQVYNVQQVKHRLMTAGMYIACTKVNIDENQQVSPQKTGHCLISCNVKAVKVIAMK